MVKPQLRLRSTQLHNYALCIITIGAIAGYHMICCYPVWVNGKNIDCLDVPFPIPRMSFSLIGGFDAYDANILI